MKRLRPDFDKSNPSVDTWYDIHEDWDLIESSIATQYGVRIRHHTDMPFDEFCSLISGLMHETPLGQIISIRSERDPKTIKGFSKEQKRIHNEWKQRSAKSKLKNEKQLENDFNSLAKLFKSLFGEKKEVSKSCQQEQRVQAE